MSLRPFGIVRTAAAILVGGVVFLLGLSGLGIGVDALYRALFGTTGGIENSRFAIPFVLLLFVLATALGGVVGSWVQETPRERRRRRRMMQLARGRCPKCDYDLRGTTGRTCPECGELLEAK